MATLKSIKKRIGSVKNTQKITRAIKLVSAAKLRKAQAAITAARPYATSVETIVTELAASIGGDVDALIEKSEGQKRKAFGLLKDRAEAKTATVILITSDRGLAGAFNSQLIKRLEAFVENDLAEYDEVSLRIVGRKGNQYFRKRDANVLSDSPAAVSETALELSRELANLAVDDYTSGNADRVFVIYNQFNSAISQEPVTKQVLPIQPPKVEIDDGEAEEVTTLKDMAYEPSKEELLVHLLPLYIQNQVYRACLESVASEYGSRMTSMDNATRNAGDMIDRLSLQYNRGRQAAITKELLEIISGAESLKG